jgi:multisubunit Na+/H+ antiporter MnhG subunit
MKKINIWALSLLIIGIIISLFFAFGPCLFNDSVSCGMQPILGIWFGWPLILIGIILFIIGLFLNNKHENKS